MQTRILSFAPPRHDLNDKSKKTSVLILCEDCSTACTAQAFAKEMVQSMGSELESSEDFWHIMMLNVPIVSSELARAASLCDHLIVSLRGDSSLSREAKQWFAKLNAPSLKLSILIDPRHCRVKNMLSTLRYLKKATRMPAFSHFPAPWKEEPKTVAKKSFMPAAFARPEMAACFA